MRRSSIRFLAYTALLVTGLLVAACASVPLEQTPVSSNPAVQTLADRAKVDVAAGRLGIAAAEFERALRIEPRNARVWYEYARVRLQQSHYRQAENLALRADTYAGGARRLRHAIWTLIAKARSGQGNAPGAAAARAKAAALR